MITLELDEKELVVQIDINGAVIQAIQTVLGQVPTSERAAAIVSLQEKLLVLARKQFEGRLDEELPI